MEKTREEIIELRCSVEATMRKAQCRAVNCDVIDTLASIARELDELDGYMTELIGD